MTLFNKLTKTFRWLRWSTVCAIVFYMFFIGLILHSTTYKLYSSMPLHSSSRTHRQLQKSPEAHMQGAASTGNNVLHPPPSEASLAVTLLDMKHKTVRGVQKQQLEARALHERRKSSQPETVILAASSVNEKQILQKAFKRADANHDAELTIKELAFYIHRKINDHIEEAIQLNPGEFRRVDISPADGVVTWEEYHRFFLKEHGMTEADIDEHDEIKHTALNRKAREDMMRDKARYTEAARTDLFSLTIDEYLAFRHPESSVTNLLELVDDILRLFDQDGDDQLTIDEFSNVDMDDDDDDLHRKSLISKTVVERRAEFKRIIDKNKDGKADRGELLDYVNPKNPRYALQDAATLFSLGDENKNGKLTLDEMVANAEIFLSSKMIDTANNFHQEY